MKKVIELIRVSTEGQAAEDRAGIPAQRAANRRTAAQYDLVIVKTIEITDVSGTAVLHSHGMHELLRLIQSPDVHGVVAKEFSRLMRPENFADYALLQQFIDTRTVLYLPDGPLDFESESGKLLAGIRALIAGQERREMLRRVHDAKEAMRRAGKNAGGDSVLPYGIGYSKEHGWYYAPEIEKVKRAFQLFLNGETCYETISRELNIPRTSVRFILGNPIYTGWRVYDECRDPSPEAYVPRPDGRQGYRRKMPRATDEVVRVRVLEPIISDRKFAHVQELIEVKRVRHWRARAEAPNRYTYNGFLTCGDCGELIYTHTGKYELYVCKSRHPRERRRRAIRGLMPCNNRYMLRKKLEPKIDHVFMRIVGGREFLERVARTYDESRPSRGTFVDRTTAVNQIRALRQKRERILDSFFDGTINKRERDLRVGLVDKEITAYEHLLSDSPGEQERPKVLDVESVLAVLEPFAQWTFLDRTAKRKLLGLLCPNISVDKYEIKNLELNMMSKEKDRYKGSHPKTARSPFPVRLCL
jgi:DNA invertase Pin-like site-specific DNA recombinase